MIAIGPIFPEQATFEEHVFLRDQMAFLERAVADLLRECGYKVLGAHPRRGAPDKQLLQRIKTILDPISPPVEER